MKDEVALPAEAVTPAVHGLVDELRERGYSPRETRYHADSFGNALLVLARDQTCVRLTRERSVWTVEVGAVSSNDYFAPVIWHAFFHSALPTREIPSREEQSQLLLGYLGRIEAVTSSFGEDELKKLQEWRSRRADELLDAGTSEE